MQTKYINNNSDKLIVFLTGWGCDDNQFKFMKSSGYDILLVYDYTNLDLDFKFNRHKKYYLISFSAGVFMAGMLKNILPKFEKTLAINGNPKAYDEYFGLTKEIVDIFYGVTVETTLDFRRKYLVYSDEEFRKFNANQSHRSFESCKAELDSLRKYDSINPLPEKFDLAILSENDKIFRLERQKEYWEARSKCYYLKNSSHFPFFTLDSYDKIMELN